MSINLVGYKQKKLLLIIINRGYLNFNDFKLIYNLTDKLIINKIKEFESLNWIKKERTSDYTYIWIKGKDFPKLNKNE